MIHNKAIVQWYNPESRSDHFGLSAVSHNANLLVYSFAHSSAGKQQPFHAWHISFNMLSNPCVLFCKIFCRNFSMLFCLEGGKSLVFSFKSFRVTSWSGLLYERISAFFKFVAFWTGTIAARLSSGLPFVSFCFPGFSVVHFGVCFFCHCIPMESVRHSDTNCWINWGYPWRKNLCWRTSHSSATAICSVFQDPTNLIFFQLPAAMELHAALSTFSLKLL